MKVEEGRKRKKAQKGRRRNKNVEEGEGGKELMKEEESGRR